ncbi:MAG TPA: hypothetical protein VHT91_11265 [Kofleriaceae bacterium]|nr:hypothetical protein [Kofleriaceae bacterium]
MIRGLGLGVSVILPAACLAALACGAGSARSSAPPGAPSTNAIPEVGPRDVHAEIEELDRSISAKLGRAQIPPPVATCSGATCTTAMSEPFTTLATDPRCRPSPGDRCSNLCTLATSICRDQERICRLAQQLRDDEWAANKCTQARASCQAAYETCCSCMERRPYAPVP